MSKYPYLRTSGEKRYRLIEIDTDRQSWLRELLSRVDELEYTVIVADFDDWDEAVAELKHLTHSRCRRLLWAERGCVGQNDQGKVWVLEAFK